MKAIFSSIILQFKLSGRDKEILTVYYIVPIAFYLFMSGVFKTVMPGMDETLIPSMVVFSGTMGAILGSPTPLIDIFATDIKKSYQVGGIPLYSAIIVNFISAFIHLFIVCSIITFTAPFLFEATLPTSGIYWLGLVLFLLASLSLATVMGVFIKENSKVTLIGQVIFLPTVMISGIMIPSSMLPSVLVTISKIFPGTWGFTLMNASELSLQPILYLVLIIIAGLIISIIKSNKAY